MMRRLVCTLLLLTTGCAGTMGPQYTMFDGPSTGGNFPAMYLEGWRHGCETGAAASANNIYKYRRLFRQDWQLAQDDTYHKGWKDAFTYCRKKVLIDENK